MQEIFDKLTPTRRRQKLALTLRMLAAGLVVGGLLAVVLAVASSLFAIPWLQIAGWVAIVGGPTIAIIAAQFSNVSWLDAARAVDRHFHLDDRVVSAVTFFEHGKLSGLHAMQIDDTVARIADLDTTQAIDLAKPKPLLIGCGWVAVAIVLLLFLPQNEAPTVLTDQESQQQENQKPDSTDKPSLHVAEDVVWSSAINHETTLPRKKLGDIKPVVTSNANTDALRDARIERAYRMNATDESQPES